MTKMHPELHRLIQLHGIPVSDRSSWEDYLWNGSNLALYWQRALYDQEYNVIGASEKILYDDFTLAHEIAHWVIADPVEREFPEYGCTIGVEARASGCQHFMAHRDNFCWNGPLTQEEQSFRELCADFLGVHWCRKFSITFDPKACPFHKYNYVQAKSAIIWLAGRGYNIQS